MVSFIGHLLTIKAKLDENAEIIGFIASRKIAFADTVREIEEMYTKYRGEEYMDDDFFMASEGYQDYLEAQN